MNEAIIYSVKMTQHLLFRLHVFLLSVVLAFSLTGCWWIHRVPPARFNEWGIRRIAVVDFSDATHHEAGAQVAEVFRQELAEAVGKEWVRLETLDEPPGTGHPVGLIGISQARALGRLNQVDALVSGQILAYQWQRKPGRVWVSVSIRLLETSRGTIIWSRNATGIAPAPSASNVNAGYNEAIKLAAKEFIHDLLGSPSGTPAG